MTEWQKEMTDRIGKQVQALRGGRTALWLSGRTEELGLKISRSAISELENGKRKSISLAEFFILAAALDVAPVMLLFPEYPDGFVEFLPGIRSTAFQAANWIGGDQLLDNGLDSGEVSLEGFGFDVVKYSRERSQASNDVLELWKSGAISHGAEIPDRIDAIKKEANFRIRQAGGTVADVEG